MLGAYSSPHLTKAVYSNLHGVKGFQWYEYPPKLPPSRMTLRVLFWALQGMALAY
jgi:hypothetical protein